MTNRSISTADIEQEGFYQTVLEELPSGVIILDIKTLEILEANRAIHDLLRYPEDDLAGKVIYDIADHSHAEISHIASLVQERTRLFVTNRRLLRSDGIPVSTEMLITSFNYRGSSGALALITEMDAEHGPGFSMGKSVQFDPITGLPNGLYFREHATERLASAKKTGDRIGLFLININRLASINARFGRQSGDMIIQQVSHRLGQHCNENCFVARLEGGDEFAVITPMNGRSLQDWESKLANAFLSRFDILGSELIEVKATVGAAMFPEHGGTHHDLLTHAYKARESARHHHSSFALYSPKTDPYGDFNLDFETEISRAIAEDEFKLFYQPILTLREPENALVGAEALIRWVHPTAGRIPPDYFIPIAEESMRVQEIDRWVIRRVLRDNAKFSQRYPNSFLDANVSALSAANRSFPAWLRDTLEEEGVNPRQLVLELTETAAMLDWDATTTNLREIRAMGVRVAIDDFGTGYSSLAYIKRLEVDMVKIDREFVSGIGNDSRDEHTVTTLIELMRDKKCRLVAEGVETAEQLEWLKREGLDYAQGYFIALPMPVDDLLKLSIPGVVKN